MEEARSQQYPEDGYDDYPDPRAQRPRRGNAAGPGQTVAQFLGFVAVAALAYCGLAWYLGGEARQHIDRFFAQQGLAATRGHTADWDAGIFSSQLLISWEVGSERTLELITDVDHYPTFTNARIKIFEGKFRLNLNNENIATGRMVTYLNNDEDLSINFLAVTSQELGVLPISFSEGAKLRYRYRQDYQRSQLDVDIPFGSIDLPGGKIKTQNFKIKGDAGSLRYDRFVQDVFISFEKLSTSMPLPGYGPVALGPSQLDIDLKMKPLRLWQTLYHYRQVFSPEQIAELRKLVTGDADIALQLPAGETISFAMHVNKKDRFAVNLALSESLLTRHLEARDSRLIDRLIRSEYLSRNAGVIQGELTFFKGIIYLNNKPLRTPIRLR